MKENNAFDTAKEFVAYRLADHSEPNLIIGSPNKGKHRFLMSSFIEEGKHKSIMLSSDDIKIGWDNLSELSIPDLEEREAVSQDYPTVFHTFHNKLVDGTFQKLVLAHPFQAQYDSAIEMFKRLCQEFPHSMIYLLYTKDSGMWIGASPELLLQQENGEWRTMALAGTKSSEDIPWDEKNIEEQTYVSQYVSTQLMPLCDDIHEEQTHTLHTGDLYHLCTEFRFTPKESLGIEKLAKALHPTPAVCGLPKAEAKEFIVKNEGIDRQYYAGYVGPIEEDGDAYLYVNIRCAKLYANGKATAFAGSGLLKNSTCESEWEEVKKKSNALFPDKHV